MIGTFERNVGGIFIYKRESDYVFYRAQGMVLRRTMPRTFNIWQTQLLIWLLATGIADV